MADSVSGASSTRHRRHFAIRTKFCCSKRKAMAGPQHDWLTGWLAGRLVPTACNHRRLPSPPPHGVAKRTPRTAVG
ncbi:hypothetical protein ZHAS_00012808 [Anopheles sinensis]|uniref:Uncharacterized protein n=1 Tax=Anopheles sinensis TaxID=74873 RepID=A0A084W3V3_ANOSI|nr:hypothetical protein ZHAS_00012808 [Anopheles sinensis]